MGGLQHFGGRSDKCGSGAVSTLAGAAGSSGTADGVGALARFVSPTGLVVDFSNNLWVADGCARR